MYKFLVVAATAIGTGIAIAKEIKKTEYSPWMFICIWTCIYITYLLVWEYIPMNDFLESMFLANMIFNFIWVFLKNNFIAQAFTGSLIIVTLFQAILLLATRRTFVALIGFIGLVVYAEWLRIERLLIFKSI